MKRPLLTDAFFDSFDSSFGDVNDSQMLPSDIYVSDEFFEFEKEALFNREWLCVARESWIPNAGDFYCSMHVGEPIVVLRDQDGAIKAMSSVCQHRGMLVAEGHGNARSLICPYHHWTYSLDGELISAPAMQQARGFDKSRIRLAQFKVETWNGFIFINFDPDAAPLKPRLAVMTEALAHFRLETAEGPRPDPPTKFPWNWKVMMENNNDGYHANKLHAGPLHNVVPSELAIFPDLPSDTAGYFRFNGSRHKDASFNPTHKSLLPVFPELTEEERGRFLFGQVPPTLSLVVRPDQITYMFLHAVSANELTMTRGWLVTPGATAQPLFAERLNIDLQSTRTIVAQDLHVDELIAIGLRSRFAARGRYSWQERSQQEFNRWLVPRYQNAWRRMKAGSA
jgi:phenylpropionate dioxygenase-like ring-hydroxylating dioxygenase large terminal subunit